jgi:antitoxin component of MazEF toxin-antitoxin module
MLKKLTKHGNSLALVIDRPMLDLLKIDPATTLDVSTDGKRLIVAPAEASVRRKKFEAAQGLAHRRYAKTFKKLQVTPGEWPSLLSLDKVLEIHEQQIEATARSIIRDAAGLEPMPER